MKLKGYDSIGEQVWSETLSNGLPVFVIPKKGFSKSFAFFATNYGGADRRFRIDGRWMQTPAGVAHFLEHKMFDTEDSNALAILSSNGASPNAFTSSDMTAYHFSSTEGFEDNLRTLLSFVSVPYFTDDSVAKEQGIIGQEIKMSEDSPGNVMYYNTLKALYRYHPMRDEIAGTVESIAEITADTLYSCHRIFYNPANRALCVVGDVSPEAIVSIASRVLPGDAGELAVRDYGEAEPATAVTPKVEAAMDVGLPIFMLGFKAGETKKGAAALREMLSAQIALQYIFGPSSRLYLDLYSEGLLHTEFGYEFECVTNRSHAIIAGESPDPDAVHSRIFDELAHIKKDGLDERVIERLKRVLYGEHLRGLDSFDSICYNYCSAYFKGYDYYELADALDSVTSRDVAGFIDSCLTDDRAALSVVRPKSQT